MDEKLEGSFWEQRKPRVYLWKRKMFMLFCHFIFDRQFEAAKNRNSNNKRNHFYWCLHFQYDWNPEWMNIFPRIFFSLTLPNGGGDKRNNNNSNNNKNKKFYSNNKCHYKWCATRSLFTIYYTFSVSFTCSLCWRYYYFTAFFLPFSFSIPMFTILDLCNKCCTISDVYPSIINTAIPMRTCNFRSTSEFWFKTKIKIKVAEEAKKEAMCVRERERENRCTAI